MSKFKLMAQGVDVSGVNADLSAHPGLWNANRMRTEQEESPHAEVNDIWLRWADPVSGLGSNDPHFAVDWSGWHALPSLHAIVRNLSHAVDARFRGAILLTETPPGCEVKPHVDRGWHPEFYTTKLYLTLQSDPKCLIRCSDEYQSFREGDVWQYPNDVVHSVENKGRVAHRNVIICFRCE